MKKGFKIMGWSVSIMTIILLLPAILITIGIAIIVVGTLGINIGAVLALLVVIFAVPLYIIRNFQYKKLKRKLKKL